MSQPRKHEPEQRASGQPLFLRGFLLAAVVVAIAALVLLALWRNRGPQNNLGAGTEPPTPNPAAPGEPGSAYQRLRGRWVRPDGGYVIEIRGADGAGKLDAGYFNPNPIHVARAEASGQGSMIKVFIELRDVNYPGSTYTLGYDQANDQLKGIYYQAVQHEQYDVVFERLK